MKYKEMLEIALKQSAIDMNCDKEDLLDKEDKIVIHKLKEDRKLYYKEKLFFHAIQYGYATVIATQPEFLEETKRMVKKFHGFRIFDMPQVSFINEALKPYDKCITHFAEYYLFDPDKDVEVNQELAIDILEYDDVFELYKYPGFINAMSYKKDNPQKDIIAAIYKESEDMVGIAAASTDALDMWQIGIDVLETHRNKSIAKTLVNRLAKEIIKRGKVPFYCTSWSNIASRKTALASGFRPTWVEMTAKDIKYAKKIANY